MATEHENNKRIAKNTLLLYFRMLLTMFVSLFTSRVILRTLGVDDFGIYNVVGGFVALFAIFSNGLSTAISRFVTFELGRGNPEKLNKVFSTSVNIQIAISIFVVVLVELIGNWFLTYKMVIPVDRLNAAFFVMQCSVVTFVVGLISVPYNAAIIAHEKMSAFAFISILETFTKLGIAYFIDVSPWDRLKTYAVLLFALSIVIQLIYGFYCKRHFAECRYKFVFDRQILKEISNFAGWSMVGLVAFVGYTQGLNVILNMFFGPVVNAARGIAVQVQNAVVGFSSNFQLALNPQIIKSYAQNELDRMHTLIFASSKYCFFLLYLLSLPLILEAPIIVKLWLGSPPEHTVNFIRILLALITVDSLGGAISCAQQASGKIKLYQIVVGGIMFMIAPVSYFVLKAGGRPESVYWVYFVAVILAHTARMFIIKNMISLSFTKYATEVLLPIVKVVCISIWIPLLLFFRMPEGLAALFIIGSISMVSVAASVYFMGLKKNERALLNDKIGVFIKKVRCHG